MLSLYGTLEPLRLLLRVSLHTVQYYGFDWRVAELLSVHCPQEHCIKWQQKKDQSPKPFDLHYYSVATRRLFSDLAKDVFWGGSIQYLYQNGCFPKPLASVAVEPYLKFKFVLMLVAKFSFRAVLFSPVPQKLAMKVWYYQSEAQESRRLTVL